MADQPSILIVCTHFPPDPVVGALRAGGLATHLEDQGWNVQVLTTPPAHSDDGPDIIRVLRDPTVSLLWKRKPTGQTPSTSLGNSAAGPDPLLQLRRWIGHHKKYLGYAMEWTSLRPERQAGLRRPDIVYSTSPGWSGAIAARRLADRWGVPLVSEFRDIWADRIYIPSYRLSTSFDRRTEAWVVRGSARVVCVTPTARDEVQRRYPSARVIHNPVGFDPKLLDQPASVPDSTGPFRIVHAGWLYGGRRDPSPLFAALQILRGAGKWPDRGLAVDFYGGDSDTVLPMAAQFGLEDAVHSHGRVPREQARTVTRTASVQLVILNSDPRETTAIPAKAFEMLPSPQPSLGLGPEGNPTEQLLARKPVSLYSRDAAQIAAWLEEQIRASAWPAPADVSDLSHPAVIEELSVHLHTVLTERNPS